MGILLASNFKDKQAWQGLINRFSIYLAHWKKHYLRKAGPLTLIKLTLATLPVYMVALFVAPCSVVNEREMIMRKFLWVSMEEKMKFHILSWDQVCISLTFGGLGIKRLRDINVSLLCKVGMSLRRQ